MASFRSAQILALLLLSAGCGGDAEGSLVFGVGTRGPRGSDKGDNKGGGAGQPTLSFGGSDGSGGGNCGPNLTGLVRDFRGKDLDGGHPDFESYAGPDASPGIVKDLLGSDKKPVYKPNGPYLGNGMNGEASHGQQTTSKADYDQWYRKTDGVNEAIEFVVPLMPGMGGNSVYDNGAFFPIDGQGFGDYAQSGHNFHFTFELHTEFVYKGGEVFTFTGDDDLWVFVNGHLGIDLGGLHPEKSRSIELDAVAQAFGLAQGSTYPLDLFHAERHTNASHFRIETSIQFTNCDAIIIPK